MPRVTSFKKNGGSLYPRNPVVKQSANSLQSGRRVSDSYELQTADVGKKVGGLVCKQKREVPCSLRWACARQSGRNDSLLDFLVGIFTSGKQGLFETRSCYIVPAHLKCAT